MKLKKMRYFETTTVSVVFGALVMIDKRINKCIDKKRSSPRRYEIQKIHLAELLIFLRGYYQP